MEPSAPDPSSPSSAQAARFLAGGGEMAALIRAKDWSLTPLGPIAGWSPSLRMMVGFLLANRFPLLLWWGPDYVSIYNEAYRPILGAKHPRALGQPVRECWAEIWHVLQPLIDTPFTGGPATWMEDLPLEINRHGFVEETHFTIAYSPVPDETAPRGIGGVLATVHEITEKVVGERRIVALRDLGTRATEAKTAAAACAAAAAALKGHAREVPFAALYLTEVDGEQISLAGTAGVAPGEDAAPRVVDLGAPPGSNRAWPFSEALRGERLVVVDGLASRFDRVPAGPWTDPPHSAVIVPVPSNTAHRPAGLLVAGISPRLRFDELYRSFFELVAGHIGTTIANARAYEEERRRSEALAEIDRAKTAFFSNVSHEFRTPLTLMLGPLEDALAGSDLPAAERERLELAHRNSLRLLKLVNTLLDFSRIEAGRAEASYQPTDLAVLTADIASNFRSACERAGLALTVDCPPLPEPVHVDRDMWEKIVLNLLSNAFKFTFEGGISVSLRSAGRQAELVVRDTGFGIPRRELPRLFERFHRIEGQQSRTYEGSGIGLALVQELIRLHGGIVAVDSEEGRGTLFTVGVPFGTAHLPQDRIAAASGLASTAVRADAFVEEALRWLPDAAMPAAPAASLGDAGGGGAFPAGTRILVADDNADIRAYLKRLLEPDCAIETVADGEAALAAIRAHRPDLVLADVMMPNRDGFGLLRAIRDDPDLRELPVILLSARADEEARIEGLAAGADDYLVKPFSARQLAARIGANLQLARVRRDATAALRASEERLQAMFDGTYEHIYVLSPDGRLLQANRAALEFADSARKEAGSRPFWETIWFANTPGAPQKLREALACAARGEFVRWEAPLARPSGDLVIFDFSLHPIRGGDGKIILIVAEGRDITERKQGEERQKLLIDELNHRVKNTLAAVQSIASQTLRAADGIGEAKKAFEGRLMALSQAHDLLTRNLWQGVMLRDLALLELLPYGAQDGGRFALDGPPLRLRPKPALALGMAFHELAANAAKYGALSNGSGQVRVAWEVVNSARPALLRLQWNEKGGPPVEPPRRQGFGSRLIEQGLAHEINGAAQLRYDPSGFVFSLTFPLDADDPRHPFRTGPT